MAVKRFGERPGAVLIRGMYLETTEKGMHVGGRRGA